MRIEKGEKGEEEEQEGRRRRSEKSRRGRPKVRRFDAPNSPAHPAWSHFLVYTS
jgi:hypothetical protein